jgi:protein TonB
LAWQLPKRLSRPVELPVAPRINFVGMAEPESTGNLGAGGRFTGAPVLAPQKSIGALPAMPPFETQPVQPLRPVIPLDVIVVVSAVPSPSTSFAAPASAIDGHGNGVENGSATGIDGNGGSGQAGYGSTTGAGRPDYRRSPRPQYPSLARQNGWEGTTILRVEVLVNGETGVVEVVESSGYRVLDDAAVEAVREARFEPARLEGVAVVCWVEVPITFRLNRGS